MDLFQRYRNLLQLDGTNQLQRILPPLEPGYIVPDERNLSDLLTYARKLAAEIRYYDLSGQSVGDWRPLLEPLVDAATGSVLDNTALETALAARHDWPPHVALFLVFLKLFRHLQDDLNELPQRHLRYYYETELGLSRQGAAADDVHVVFELAKNAPSTLLRAGTKLDAKKDKQGNPLVYVTKSDLVVSEATLADIRRVVTEIDQRGNRRFFAADAIAESEAKSWDTFGSKQLDLDPSQRTMTEAKLGFAIASPVLRLAEGTRTIDVIASLRVPPGMESPSPQPIGHMLEFAFTGSEGWLTPDSVSANLVDAAGQLSLQMVLNISEAAAAIVPFNASLHGEGPTSKWPVLRCLIKGSEGVYDTLDNLTVQSILIKVDVQGVRNLLVQNSDGPLSASKPIPLFGSQPRLGSPFYIGSSEIFSKKLSYLAFNLEWQSPPDNLYDHYRGYFDNADGGLTAYFRSYFRVDIDLLYDRTWDHPLLVDQFLFAPGMTGPQRISADESLFKLAFSESRYDALPSLNVLENYNAGSKRGFACMTLRGPTRSNVEQYTPETPYEAFGHQAFPSRYASQAIALAHWTAPAEKPLLPNEPYTPVLASLALDYRASANFVPGNQHAAESLYVLGPFGFTEAGGAVAARLIPEFEGVAALFLGFDKLQVPANLSMLFQIDTGTVRAIEALRPSETYWSYLRDEQWQPLPSTSVLNDSTYGFQKPGLVVISVPKEATTRHTSMPKDLVWLRVHIQSPPESASRTLALHTQSALAELAVDAPEINDYAQHLQNGLNARSITGLTQRNAAIKRVIQPYASFNGNGPESDAGYFRRCSERLRHRNRAVTPWDFERLVLEVFSEVFKVKCLPHTSVNKEGETDYLVTKAGETALVIVPDLRNTASTNPLEPRAGEVLMGQVEDFVTADLATPFSSVHVIHPEYERLRVDIHVAFQSGLDAGWYTSVLNDDLRRFLSPWAYTQNEDIVFGARIYKSEILAFIEGREYVDYVVAFNLYHSYDGPPRDGIGELKIGSDFIIRPDPKPATGEMVVGKDFIVGRDVEVAHTTQPHAILVSHPQHLITPVSPGERYCTGVTQLGIGYMTVSLDFKVQPEYA